jgi:hypothetical protein
MSVWKEVDKLDRQQRAHHRHYLNQKVQAKRLVERCMFRREKHQVTHDQLLALETQYYTEKQYHTILNNNYLKWRHQKSLF